MAQTIKMTKDNLRAELRLIVAETERLKHENAELAMSLYNAACRLRLAAQQHDEQHDTYSKKLFDQWATEAFEAWKRG